MRTPSEAEQKVRTTEPVAGMIILETPNSVYQTTGTSFPPSLVFRTDVGLEFLKILLSFDLSQILQVTSFPPSVVFCTDSGLEFSKKLKSKF